LIGIAKKDGVIPDGDIDVCVYYEDVSKWRNIVKHFYSHDYRMSKALLNDTDREKILYMGFNYKHVQTKEQYISEEFFPHICVSFWYLHKGIRYYCHDQHHEVAGEDVPKAGYFFKGFDNQYIEDVSLFKRVEWPGIPGNIKISAPMLPCLEQMYPCYIYNQQRYMVQENQVQHDKLRDTCRSGAISRYQVRVKSMGDWNNENHVRQQLEDSETKWRAKLKLMKKA
jgi:hypothetical protein